MVSTPMSWWHTDEIDLNRLETCGKGHQTYNERKFSLACCMGTRIPSLRDYGRSDLFQAPETRAPRLRAWRRPRWRVHADQPTIPKSNRLLGSMVYVTRLYKVSFDRQMKVADYFAEIDPAFPPLENKFANAGRTAQQRYFLC